MIRTSFNTCATADTFTFCVQLLRLNRNAFRVVTPDAGEWAAFEKYGNADAGTVVYGVAFDVED